MKSFQIERSQIRKITIWIIFFREMTVRIFIYFTVAISRQKSCNDNLFLDITIWR